MIDDTAELRFERTSPRDKASWALKFALISLVPATIAIWRWLFAPTGIADDFVNGRSYRYLGNGEKILFFVSLFVWLFFVLMSVRCILWTLSNDQHVSVSTGASNRIAFIALSVNLLPLLLALLLVCLLLLANSEGLSILMQGLF
jgi:hypothetical protein